MKQLLNLSLQAVLDADMGEVEPLSGDSRGLNSIEPSGRHEKCHLSSQFGRLKLQVRLAAAQNTTELFVRYAARERELLVILARMIAHGRATKTAARAFSRALCGHALGASAVETVERSLNRGLERYTQRELAREATVLSAERFTRVRPFELAEL